MFAALAAIFIAFFGFSAFTIALEAILSIFLLAIAAFTERNSK